jgi:hypothetical protein
MDWSQTDASAISRRRNSSKLSLGSTPSSPISTDAADDDDGDAPLTPTERLVDDEDEDDAMLSLNGVLSTDEKDDDDNDDHALRNSSPSTLSSVPDDFPLSRSSSPVSDPHPPPIYSEDQTDVVNNKHDNVYDPTQVEEEKASQDQEDDQDEDDEDNQKPPPRRRTRSRRTGAGRRTRKRKLVREDPDEEPSISEERKSRNGRVSEKFKTENADEQSHNSDSNGSGRTQRKRTKVDSAADEHDDDESKEDTDNQIDSAAPVESEDITQPMTTIKEEEDDVVSVRQDPAVTNGEAKSGDLDQDEAQNEKSTDPDDDEPSHARDVEGVSPAAEPEDGASVATGAEDDEGEDQGNVTFGLVPICWMWFI